MFLYMVEVIPGILEANPHEIERKIKLVAPYVSWVQIDVADGTLVENETFLNFASFPEVPDGVLLEAHLMVEHPEQYIPKLANAGFSRLIAHVECADPRVFLQEAEYEEVEVGLALDGTSEVDLIEPFLESIDVALIMAVEAGFSGQPFLPETMDKVRIIQERFPDLPIAVDGGINDKTARIAIEAGADRLVSTTYLFKNPARIEAAIRRLKKFEDFDPSSIDAGEIREDS